MSFSHIYRSAESNSDRMVLLWRSPLHDLKRERKWRQRENDAIWLVTATGEVKACNRCTVYLQERCHGRRFDLRTFFKRKPGKILWEREGRERERNYGERGDDGKADARKIKDKRVNERCMLGRNEQTRCLGMISICSGRSRSWWRNVISISCNAYRIIGEQRHKRKVWDNF